MDWAKAKNILIAVFLLLNIFLFSTIVYTSSTLRFQSDYTRNAYEYLQSRDIQIDTKIPDTTGQVGKMVYDRKNFDFSYLTRYVFGNEVNQSISGDSILYSEGNEKIELVVDSLYIRDKLEDGLTLFSDSKTFSQKLYNYLDDIGYSRGKLSLQSQDETDHGKQMVFVLKHKKGLLFNQTITATIDAEGFLNLSIPAWEVKRTNDPSEIISAYQVLVMSGLPNGSILKSVDFGYRQIVAGELYDTPVWRVILSDGAIYFYNAYTGEEL